MRSATIVKIKKKAGSPEHRCSQQQWFEVFSMCTWLSNVTENPLNLIGPTHAKDGCWLEKVVVVFKDLQVPLVGSVFRQKYERSHDCLAKRRQTSSFEQVLTNGPVFQKILYFWR